MSLNVKEVAKKGAELWAVKKGMGLTGSLLKWGLIAGAGYFVYSLFKDDKDETEDQFDDMHSDY